MCTEGSEAIIRTYIRVASPYLPSSECYVTGRIKNSRYAKVEMETRSLDTLAKGSSSGCAVIRTPVATVSYYLREGTTLTVIPAADWRQ